MIGCDDITVDVEAIKQEVSTVCSAIDYYVDNENLEAVQTIVVDSDINVVTDASGISSEPDDEDTKITHELVMDFYRKILNVIREKFSNNGFRVFLPIPVDYQDNKRRWYRLAGYHHGAVKQNPTLANNAYLDDLPKVEGVLPMNDTV